MTCGLQEGDFVVLGARPSMGRLRLRLMLDCMRQSGVAVGLFSLEMSKAIIEKDGVLRRRSVRR